LMRKESEFYKYKNINLLLAYSLFKLGTP
jgi:hypothetical protein